MHRSAAQVQERHVNSCLPVPTSSIATKKIAPVKIVENNCNGYHQVNDCVDFEMTSSQQQSQAQQQHIPAHYQHQEFSTAPQPYPTLILHQQVPSNPTYLPQQQQLLTTIPIDVAQRLSFGSPSTLLNAESAVAASNIVVQQHLSQLDAVRQQISREVESIKLKLDNVSAVPAQEAAAATTSFVNELKEMRNQISKLQDHARSPGLQQHQQQQQRLTSSHQHHQHNVQQQQQSQQLADRLLSEVADVRDQIAKLAENGHSAVASSREPVENMQQRIDAERKRFEQLLRMLTGSIAAASSRSLRQQQQTSSPAPVAQSQQPIVTPIVQQQQPKDDSANQSAAVISELRRVVSSLMAELSELRAQLRDAESQLSEASALRHRQQGLESDMARLRESHSTALTELKSQLVVATERQAKLTTDLERRSTELELAQSAKTAHEQAALTKDAEIRRISSELQQAKAEVLNADQRADRLAAEVQRKADRIIELEKRLATAEVASTSTSRFAQRELLNTNADLEVVRIENTELKTQVQRMRQQLDDSAGLIGRLKADLNSAEVELDRQNSFTSYAHREREDDIRLADEQLASLRGKLETARREAELTAHDLEISRQERLNLLDELSKAKLNAFATSTAPLPPPIVVDMATSTNAALEARAIDDKELRALKRQLDALRSSLQLFHDEQKAMLLLLAGECDAIVDKVVFAFSLVKPQLSPSPGAMCGDSGNFATISSPPCPLNPICVSSLTTSDCAGLIQDKLRWISSNLDNLCHCLDNFQLQRRPPSVHFNTMDQVMMDQNEAGRGGRLSDQHARNSFSPRFEDEDDHDFIGTAWRTIQNDSMQPPQRRNREVFAEASNRRRIGENYPTQPFLQTVIDDATSECHCPSDIPWSRTRNNRRSSPINNSRGLTNRRRTLSTEPPITRRRCQSRPDSSRDREKVLDLLDRSQKVLFDLKSDLADSAVVMSKIRGGKRTPPTTERQSSIPPPCDGTLDNGQATDPRPRAYVCEDSRHPPHYIGATARRMSPSSRRQSPHR